MAKSERVQLPIPKLSAYKASKPFACSYAEVFDEQVYDKHFPLKKGMTVLDGGACVGMFTLKAAQAVGPEGKVIAVEPHEEAFRWLKRNVEVNGFKNVVFVNKALWSSTGNAVLNVGWLGATSLVKAYRGDTALVDTITVGKLLRDLKISGVDFVKIDTEGAEYQILKNYAPSPHTYFALEVHTKEDELSLSLHFVRLGFNTFLVKRMGMASMMYATDITGWKSIRLCNHSQIWGL